jgi:hypothetical protein
MLHQNKGSNFSFPLIIFLASFGIGSFLIIYQGLTSPIYTIDSYYYLDKAKSLSRGQGLTVSWNDGTDNKFLPGYSVLLVPFIFLGTNKSWILLQIILYFLFTWIIIAVGQKLGLKKNEGYFVGSLFLSHPIIIKWFSLPMAEGAALFWCWLAVWCLFKYCSTSRSYFMGSGFLAIGIAIITRMEACYLLVIIWVIWLNQQMKGKRPPLSPLLWGSALAAIPLALWIINIWAEQGGLHLQYLTEFSQTLTGESAIIWNRFLYYLSGSFELVGGERFFIDLQKLNSSGATPLLVLPYLWKAYCNLLVFIFHVGLIIAFSGVLKDKGLRYSQALTLILVGYFFLHSFWYYTYERFLILVLPLSIIIFFWAIKFLFTRGNMIWSPKEATRIHLILLQMILVVLNFYLAFYSTEIQKAALSDDAANIARIDRLGARLNRIVSSSLPIIHPLGPYLAYYLKGHSFFLHEMPHFYRPINPRETMLTTKIGYILSPVPLTKWLRENGIPKSQWKNIRLMTRTEEGLFLFIYHFP